MDDVVVVLTATNQLPVLMAHNHHSPDVHIVLLEGILKQLESRQLEKRNSQLSLFYLEFSFGQLRSVAN